MDIGHDSHLVYELVNSDAEPVDGISNLFGDGLEMSKGCLLGCLCSRFGIV